MIEQIDPCNDVNEQVVRTVCNSHCGGMCEVKVHVKNGKITHIETVGSNATKHKMCLRGRAYRQRVYAPDRLLYPLKRAGRRGSGKFVRVSWEDALEQIASEMKKVKDAYGNSSILHFCSMADPYTIHHVQSFHRLLCQFGGYTAPWGTISNEAANFSVGTTYGMRCEHVMHPPEAFENAKLIIMWGWNPVTTNMGTHYPLSLARAKENGAKVVSVDPRHTDSAASFANQWIPIKPGTDAAALVAMAFVIIKEKLYDRDFVDRYTFGFDKFADYVLGAEDGVKKTPEWAEAISGVPAASLIALAREYALTKPAVLGTHWAAGRTAFGEQYHRAAASVEAITGNVRTARKSVPPYYALYANALVFPKDLRHIPRIPSPPNQVELNMPPRSNALPYRGSSVNSSARVNVNLLSDAILKGKAGGYPADYKFFWLSNTAYLNQLSDINKAIDAFKKLDFVLVTEQFMTPTARYADIVLPVCTYLERNDFLASAEGGLYGMVNKAIEPLGESKSQLEICKALAPKIGIRDFCDKTDEELIKSIVARIAQVVEIPSYEGLKESGIYMVARQNPAFIESNKILNEAEDKRFHTPSGKIELYSQVIADLNDPQIPSVPKYIETWESPTDPVKSKYPLQLITPHFKRRAHSQFDNLPWLQDLQTQAISINSTDAELRDIQDGCLVKVFNERGKMIIRARVTERIMPGVVAIPEGAWYTPDENGIDLGGSANVLTKNVTSPGGAFPSNTALVEVERYNG